MIPRKPKHLCHLIAFSLAFIVLLILLGHNRKEINFKTRAAAKTPPNLRSQSEDYDILDFEEFDNQKGANSYIVPNIVHLLYLQTTEIQFYQALNIYSIFLNLKPDLIYIHCDDCRLHGHYWEEMNSIQDLKNIIQVKQLQFHRTIFGKEYGWINHHRSDVLRLLLLMNYGGIFLDNDVYVVNSLDQYRKFEMTVSWDDQEPAIGVQVMIANRNARLLKAHFDVYR